MERGGKEVAGRELQKERGERWRQGKEEDIGNCNVRREEKEKK